MADAQRAINRALNQRARKRVGADPEFNSLTRRATNKVTAPAKQDGQSPDETGKIGYNRSMASQRTASA